MPSPHGPSTSYATATLLVGIGSIFGVALCLIGLPFAVGALGMGMHTINRCNRHPDLFAGSGRAIVGMVCGGFALVLAALFFLMGLFFF